MPEYHGRAGIDFPPNIGALAWQVASNTLTHRLPVIMKKVETFLRDVTPERTGLMKSMVRSWGERVGAMGGWSFSYGWRKTEWPGRVFYPEFVLSGTGLHGPRHTPIVPIRAPFLVWEDDEGQVYVKRSVRGQHPQDLFGAVEGDVSETMTKEMNMAVTAGFRSIKNTKDVFVIKR